MSKVNIGGELISKDILEAIYPKIPELVKSYFTSVFEGEEDKIKESAVNSSIKTCHDLLSVIDEADNTVEGILPGLISLIASIVHGMHNTNPGNLIVLIDLLETQRTNAANMLTMIAVNKLLKGK